MWLNKSFNIYQNLFERLDSELKILLAEFHRGSYVLGEYLWRIQL